MLYSMLGSIVSVVILMKCTKVVGYQRINPKQGQTCRSSKNVTPRCLYIYPKEQPQYNK